MWQEDLFIVKQAPTSVQRTVPLSGAAGGQLGWSHGGGRPQSICIRPGRKVPDSRSKHAGCYGAPSKPSSPCLQRGSGGGLCHRLAGGGETQESCSQEAEPWPTQANQLLMIRCCADRARLH